MATSALKRIRLMIAWPFTNRFAAPLWLALRLWLAWIWFQMGWGKIASGWLTNDPLARLLDLVAQGKLPVPLEAMRGFAGWLVESGMTVYLARAIPFLELSMVPALLTGVLLVPASVGGILLMSNIILMGIGSLMFDGRMIVLHVLLILGYRVAALIGFESFLIRMFRSAQAMLFAGRIGQTQKAS